MKFLMSICTTLAFGLMPAMGTATPLSGLDLVTLNGKALTPSAVNGKVALVVNVASRCGYTRQYEGLQKLYKSYQDKGLVVLGAPCNQFGGQEPGTADEIAQFCKRNFGVTFPILSKQDVNGNNRSKLYRYLISSPAGQDKDIRWNFEKFLVDRDGKVLARFPSSTRPDAPELLKAIEAAL